MRRPGGCPEGIASPRPLGRVLARAAATVAAAVMVVAFGCGREAPQREPAAIAPPQAQPDGFEPDGGQEPADRWQEPADDMEPDPADDMEPDPADGAELPVFERVVVDHGSELPDVEPGPGDGSEPTESERAVDGGDAAPGEAEDPGGPVDEAPADLPGPLRFQFEPGGLFFELGSKRWPDRYELEGHRDEVAVRRDSVLVRGGVVRGLVQNMSDRLFARGVTVSVGEGRWVFPLTLQPTEVAPFVIEGYQGPSDPASISFEVAARFVPEPDPKRSLHISGLPGTWGEHWSDAQHRLPAFLIEVPEGLHDDDWGQYFVTSVNLYVPTSHPSIAEEVRSVTIDDLRVYLTWLDADDRVLDARELVPYQSIEVGVYEDGWPRWGYTPIDRLPANGYTGFQVGFLLRVLDGAWDDADFVFDADFALTVGGAHGTGKRLALGGSPS